MRYLISFVSVCLFYACAAGGGPLPPALPLVPVPMPPQDVDARPSPEPVLLSGATILTAAGKRYARGYVFMRNGLIAAVGEGTAPKSIEAQVPPQRRFDVQGKFITPGIIDTHSHIGVYPIPEVSAHADGNESTGPVTAEVWAEHAFWPQDPSIPRVVSGGVTTIQVLPGSANLIGGRSFVAKLRTGSDITSAREMRFAGAPQGLKMACGENPKRVYGAKGGPKTRMGNAAAFRAQFQKAWNARRAQETYERDLAYWQSSTKDKGEDPPTPPERDFSMETLMGVLKGDILVHVHCYRADDLQVMLDLAEEFQFKIRSFHHALEAYKIAPRLAQNDVAVSTWSDWWGFKMEAFDGIPQNAALLSVAGVRTIIHSDSAIELQYLNHEAAKARSAGLAMGLDISEDMALRWVTANPAWALGIDDRVGTLEVNKMADVVVWNGHPFSVYTLAEKVFIDGRLEFDRERGRRPTDFELGQAQSAQLEAP